MTIRDMITKWGFKVDHDPLEKLEKQLEGIKHRLDFLASVEVLKGLFELTENFAKFAEEMHVAAENAGITVEAFQKLAFAASKSSVSSEELGGAMARLSRHLYEAKKGGAEAQKTFADAGFSPAQIAGFKNGQDVLFALSGRFQQIQDPMKKSAIAMELMGRSGYHMVSFLNKGPNALKATGEAAEILSEDQVHALVEVEHAMADLWNIVKTFSATIASYLAPNVRDAIESFKEFYDINKKTILLTVREWVYDFSYALGFLWGIMKGMITTIIEWTGQHQTLAKAILYTAGIIGILATGMLAAIQVGAFFINMFEKGQRVYSFTKDLWALVMGVKEWSIWSKIAAAATWLWNTAMSVLTAEVAFIEAPVWLVVAAIAALVLIGQALWKVFTGGSFKDTWIGQMLDWIGGLDLMNIGVTKLMDTFKNLASYLPNLNLGGVLDKVSGLLHGEPGADGSPGKSMFSSGLGAIQNLTGLGQIQSPGAPPGQGAVAGDMNYEVNAPITITVPPGTDGRAVGESVRDAVKAHLDQVHRETSRSLRPAQAY